MSVCKACPLRILHPCPPPPLHAQVDEAAAQRVFAPVRLPCGAVLKSPVIRAAAFGGASIDQLIQAHTGEGSAHTVCPRTHAHPLPYVGSI